jgi:hypothetical protein
MIELKNAKTKEDIDITEKKLDEIENKRALCHSMDMDTLRKISNIEASHAGTKREAADIQQYFDQRIERIEKIEKEINAASKRQRNAAREIAEINIEENIENQI